jgi:hypothetical protein
MLVVLHYQHSPKTCIGWMLVDLHSLPDTEICQDIQRVENTFFLHSLHLRPGFLDFNSVFPAVIYRSNNIVNMSILPPLFSKSLGLLIEKDLSEWCRLILGSGVPFPTWKRTLGQELTLQSRCLDISGYSKALHRNKQGDFISVCDLSSNILISVVSNPNLPFNLVLSSELRTQDLYVSRSTW